MLTHRYDQRVHARQLVSAVVADNAANLQAAGRALAGPDSVGCIAHTVQLVANHSISPLLDNLFTRVAVRCLAIQSVCSLTHVL